MSSPLISVIVPIYMIDKYVGLCIESLLAQTFKNLEIILVDDGSKDRCAEICDLYASKDDRIKVIHKPNGGLVSARKAGILSARGAFIGYVDGDDWVGPGFYQSLYNSIVECDADIIVAGFSRDLFSKESSILNAVPSGVYEGNELQSILNKIISYESFFRHGITTYLWNKLFKREAIIEYQLSVDDDITIGEDAAAVYPAIFNAKKICITDNVAYHYRQREDSMLKTSTAITDDSRRLKKLYDVLSSSLKAYNHYRAQEQIDDLLLTTYIIRSGGILPANCSENLYFPYSNDIKGKNVVIYGAGTFGQQLKKRFSNDDVCHIIKWIDIDYWEYRRCCLDVDPVTSINSINFDYVIIASFDQNVIQSNIRLLKDYGVPENKILKVEISESQKSLFLNQYLNQ